MSEPICSTCSHSIWCPTWAEWKCKLKGRRIYSDNLLSVTCPDHKKRDKTFKESACQCESCLKNEALHDNSDDNI